VAIIIRASKPSDQGMLCNEDLGVGPKKFWSLYFRGNLKLIPVKKTIRPT
jgi:hypothetical protein